MHGTAFDGWTRRLHSRRAVGLTLVGLGVGLGGTRQTIAAPTPAKKPKPKRPTFGCTKRDNLCTTDASTSCPDAPAGPGGFCVNDNKGKPFCAADGGCVPCMNNRDCAAVPGAICIKTCSFCQRTVGVKTACLVPLTDH